MCRISTFILFGALIGFNGGCSRCSQKIDGSRVGGEKLESAKVTKVPGDMRFQFKKMKSELLAKSGDLILEKKDLKDQSLDALLLEREDLRLAFTYRQIVNSETFATEEGGGRIQFLTKPPLRNFQDLLNQYGLQKKENWTVSFSKGKMTEKKVKINGKLFDLSDFKMTSLQWGGVESVSYTHLTLPTTPYV